MDYKNQQEKSSKKYKQHSSMVLDSLGLGLNELLHLRDSNNKDNLACLEREESEGS